MRFIAELYYRRGAIVRGSSSIPFITDQLYQNTWPVEADKRQLSQFHMQTNPQSPERVSIQHGRQQQQVLSPSSRIMKIENHQPWLYKGRSTEGDVLFLAVNQQHMALPALLPRERLYATG
jgi:hypothetical protein